MSSKPIPCKKIAPYSIPHQPAFGNTSLLSCVQQNQISVKVLPQATQLPRKSGLLKKVKFLGKVLPQAAQLPRTSGFFKKELEF